jgi:hypothetical protein
MYVLDGRISLPALNFNIVLILTLFLQVISLSDIFISPLEDLYVQPAHNWSRSH